jgi:pullulanase/glycogen debranching enzyme
MIAEDPILRSTKLIAEAWDCDGLNQVCSLSALRLQI